MATVVTLLTVLLAIAACQKDLVRWPNYLKTHYKVNFDWADAPYASPSIMEFVAFPKNGSAMQEFGFRKYTGGEVDLAAGDYQAVSFNEDTETLFTRGATWDTFEIYTRETTLANYSKMFSSRAVPRGVGSEDEMIIEEPDMLWTGSAKEMPQAGNNRNEEVTLLMQPSVFTYHFTITGVANLDFVSEITATISGMSGSMFPSSGKASDTHCIIPIMVRKSGDQSVECTVRSFGHCPHLDGLTDIGQAESANHHLVVYARLSDGSKWYYDFDVTGDLHDPHHVIVDDHGDAEMEIILDELPFPRPISEDSGLHPNVEEWNEVEVDIKM